MSLESLPPYLHQQLREILLRCGPFDTHQALTTYFVNARISPWKHNIPQTNDADSRVRALISYLLPQASDQDENALLLFVEVLAEEAPRGTACRRDLEQMAIMLRQFERDGFDIHPTLSNYYQPTIFEKTREFVGRDYVFKAISEFLANQASGYFIVEGDPGVGKSTILAEFVRRTGYISHFNIRSLGVTRADQFLESISEQIIDKYNLPYTSLPSNASQDGVFLSKLLKEVSSHFKKDESLVIVVDALDEVDLSTLSSGSNVLYLPTLLPDNIFFIMSQRPRKQANLPFVTQNPEYHFDLTEYQNESKKDIEIYIEHAIERLALQAWIERQNLTSDSFISTLANKSENNFMYLQYVLQAIKGGFYQDFTLEELPKGLQAYYTDHWRLMGMTTKPLPRAKIKIVYTLAEATEPIPRSIIARYVREDEITTQEVLDEWDQFLHEQSFGQQICYSVYHTSFREFLHRQDIIRATGITLEVINSQIAQVIEGWVLDEE